MILAKVISIITTILLIGSFIVGIYTKYEGRDLMLLFEIWPEKEEDYDLYPLTIQGEDLRAFLALCFEDGVWFSLQRAPWFQSVDSGLENELRPFLNRVIETDRWFGYVGKMTIQIYRADPAAKDILLRYMDDIFGRVFKNGELDDTTQTLEDLCIFSEDRLIMGTVSHEFMLAVDPLNDRFRQNLPKFGRWAEEPPELYAGMPLDISEFV